LHQVFQAGGAGGDQGIFQLGFHKKSKNRNFSQEDRENKNNRKQKPIYRLLNVLL